jgi:hypothetical protein
MLFMVYSSITGGKMPMRMAARCGRARFASQTSSVLKDLPRASNQPPGISPGVAESCAMASVVNLDGVEVANPSAGMVKLAG